MDDKQGPRGLAVPSGRVARLTRLGRMTAGVAGNMAVGGLASLGRGQRPNMQDLLLTPRNIGRIADELAKMRGAAMKMGQLLSMDTGDVLPPELSQIMARLRDDANVMPPKQLKTVLSEQWGEGWLRGFKRFDVRPIAAASIGQVHRAQTRDGRDLAIKVQYPGVARSIDSDVANVGALIKMTGLLPKGFALDPYLDEARKQLHLETDYAAEAQFMAWFEKLLAGDDRFAVPHGQADWSTAQILAMDYIDSIPIEDVAQDSQDVRDRVAHDLIDLMLRELFDFGVMQTDPNFANYRYDGTSGRIVLLDFGATREMATQTADQYRKLVRAGLEGDSVQMQDVALDIGFIAPETDPTHVDMILGMMRTVFAALTATSEYSFDDPALSETMQAQGMKLAHSGFIPPPLPMDAVFLQRKFAGMFLLAARLKARVPITAMLARWV